MHKYTANKIAVRIPSLYLLHCVVVEDADLQIICTRNYPLLAQAKFCAAYWRHRILDILYCRLVWVIVNCDVAWVQSYKHPRHFWMQFYTFHALWAWNKLLLHLELYWLCIMEDMLEAVNYLIFITIIRVNSLHQIFFFFDNWWLIIGNS